MQAKKLPGYVAGMTWGWTGIRGTWNTPEAVHSMKEMKNSLGVNWTAIALGALQDTAQSTEIHFEEEPTVTDAEVRWAIHEAKSLGLHVCLKPVVNCADGTWRAHINFFDMDVPCEPKWSDWFASYTRFMLHYAVIAEETGCEMLCIGCEMVQTDRREQEWRQLIQEVRKVYSGLITYNCDKYQENQIKWWDAVDIISSSGYYPVGTWEEQLSRIEPVVQKHGKPFFLMEAGCPSRTGSSQIPNNWGLPGTPSEDEQVEYYNQMFQSCGRQDWVSGFMLWDWPAVLYKPETAAVNDDYCPYAKKAAQVIRGYYDAKTQLLEGGQA
ncbi:glycoside hydrolase family 113 [Paenibacillus dokdonensis]|uniref:glycoside hydrolase family 113 n=1 Tax=Paenibacillus dokdonensis TaxID=2567944 RepID=UPI0010A7697D|nr:1,4-beta-xylanase [Paenibacillus dokdonensis]